MTLNDLIKEEKIKGVGIGDLFSFFALKFAYYTFDALQQARSGEIEYNRWIKIGKRTKFLELRDWFFMVEKDSYGVVLYKIKDCEGVWQIYSKSNIESHWTILHNNILNTIRDE